MSSSGSGFVCVFPLKLAVTTGTLKANEVRRASAYRARKHLRDLNEEATPLGGHHLGARLSVDELLGCLLRVLDESLADFDFIALLLVGAAALLLRAATTNTTSTTTSVRIGGESVGFLELGHFLKHVAALALDLGGDLLNHRFDLSFAEGLIFVRD